MIKKAKAGYRVVSSKGKNLGGPVAKKRLRQVELQQVTIHKNAGHRSAGLSNYLRPCLALCSMHQVPQQIRLGVDRATMSAQDAAAAFEKSFQHSRAMAQSSCARITRIRTIDSGDAISVSTGFAEFLVGSRAKFRNEK